MQGIGQGNFQIRQQLGQHLNHCHLDAERLHHAGKLAADDAAAHDQQALGQGGPVQRLVAGADEIGVRRPAGDAGDDRAGCQNDLVSGELGSLAFVGDDDLAQAIELGGTAIYGGLPRRQQPFDPPAQSGQYLVLAFLDVGPIEADAGRDVNAQIAGVANVVQEFSRRE